MLERDGLYGLLCVSIASWCNGSTRDSGSLCLGSNPSEAARRRFGYVNQVVVTLVWDCIRGVGAVWVWKFDTTPVGRMSDVKLALESDELNRALNELKL